MTIRVFISYSSEDEALHSALSTAINQSDSARHELNLSLGKSLADGLRSQIDECDVCVFLATRRSLKSPWCLAELGAFWGAGKRVIIYLADPSIKQTDLPPQFANDLWTKDSKELIKDIQRTDSHIVQRTSEGYCTSIGRMNIKVKMGRIEDVDCSDESCMIALPANEYFDDACIYDRKSSLGAFMQHHFEDHIEEIQSLVRSFLVNEPSKEFEKTPGNVAHSFGVGKCVFLDRPLSSCLRIGLTSITTQRADEGLRAEASYIFAASASIQRAMCNHRLTRLYVPLLGSGNGGIKEEISLVSMLIAFGELHRNSAYKIKDLTIIIFKSGVNAEPSVPENTIRRALDFARRHLGE